jgi:hypothetical protein
MISILGLVADYFKEAITDLIDSASDILSC